MDDRFEDPLLLPERKGLEAWCGEVHPQALENLSELLERVDVKVPMGHWVFPHPPIGEDEDPEQVLRQHIERGYGYRKMEKTQEVLDRVEFEFSIIKEKGYVDYFLSVIDLVEFMKENKILSTTRGSAAGSMISYLCGITSVDPIEYKLPFERFLNPFRPSPPDIDLDIADDKRNLVISYISERYGPEKVAQIGTLGTMMARAAIRDSARALGYSYTLGDTIAKLIPPSVQGAPQFIGDALEREKDLKELYKKDEQARHVVDIAQQIEGNPRHISIHAAGVVISRSPITDYTPLERNPEGKLVTQYNMHALEDVGLIKFDILGLTNLAVLSSALEIVEGATGEVVDIDAVPLDDEATFRMISKGYTKGVFQLGGAGMTAILKRMQPTSLDDLAAIIALYRPGPMENIDEYIARKSGDKKVEYLHPKMKDFLETSYGVLVYQDDLLYTALSLANYNWEEVDVFRKAVGKKIPKLFAEQEKLFKQRCRDAGLSASQVDSVWKAFVPFGGYGFNKAHAMSYAKVAYHTAYVKRHYTTHYMVAQLNAARGDVDEVSDLVREAENIGIRGAPARPERVLICLHL